MKILNTQYSILNTQYSILNTQYSILNTQYSARCEKTVRRRHDEKNSFRILHAHRAAGRHCDNHYPITLKNWNFYVNLWQNLNSLDNLLQNKTIWQFAGGMVKKYKFDALKMKKLRQENFLSELLRIFANILYRKQIAFNTAVCFENTISNTLFVM